MLDIKNFSQAELKEYLVKYSFPSFTARQVFGWLYNKRVEKFSLMTDISKEARLFLEGHFLFSRLKLIKRERSRDGTEKFLFQLNDASLIESVLIPESSRLTLCLSSQVGCKFKCKFCSSGQKGLKRNLEAAEIISQYLESVNLAKGKITNIVFMGIGEPLDNFDNVVRGTAILADKDGLNFGRHRICLSTAGIIPAIEKLKHLNLGVKLSISLHSADSRKRSSLMPINKIYPLEELIKSLKSTQLAKGYPLTFEYILIKNFNTAEEDADKLAKLLKGLNCKINLISCNDAVMKDSLPSLKQIEEFKARLKKNGLFFTLRKSRGQDINAACGQLKAIFEAKKDS